MSLRFFADHCVPALVIRLLRDQGHEVFVIKEHIPPDSKDPTVIAKAQELDAMLVSLNGDFSGIVTYPPAAYRGIISLQVRNHPEAITALWRRSFVGFWHEVERSTTYGNFRLRSQSRLGAGMLLFAMIAPTWG